MKPTILLIGDDAGANSLITSALSHQYKLINITGASPGLPTDFVSDAILVILDLSRSEFFARLRRQTEWLNVPVLLLATKSQEELKIKLLAEGAQDFLDKPFLEAELCVRVENLVSIKKSRDRHRDLFESMEDGFCIIEVIF